MFTESLALELRGSGVRVQALCPGFTLTEFHDDPKYAEYHIKERVPGWLWMTSNEVVLASLKALNEDQVVFVPGLKNQLIVVAGRSGLSKLLMGILASFFPKQNRLPASSIDLLVCPMCHCSLELKGNLNKGALACQSCGKEYPILIRII